MWDIFGVAKSSNIFLGCLKFLIFFGVNGRCWVRAYVCRKNRVPPWALHLLKLEYFLFCMRVPDGGSIFQLRAYKCVVSSLSDS